MSNVGQSRVPLGHFAERSHTVPNVVNPCLRFPIVAAWHVDKRAVMVAEPVFGP